MCAALGSASEANVWPLRSGKGPIPMTIPRDRNASSLLASTPQPRGLQSRHARFGRWTDPRSCETSGGSRYTCDALKISQSLHPCTATRTRGGTPRRLLTLMTRRNWPLGTKFICSNEVPKSSICRAFEGERRDLNPRPPGPQPDGRRIDGWRGPAFTGLGGGGWL
jgi:hypothetical protein